jgi:hypothetical protein
MKIFSNQRPSSVLVVKRSFGIREPPVPLFNIFAFRDPPVRYFNILESENRQFLFSTFWNQRTASSYFQHFGIRDPPVISKPTKSWWGFRFLSSAVLLSIGK